jgi:RHS repeat-associated protein
VAERQYATVASIVPQFAHWFTELSCDGAEFFGEDGCGVEARLSIDPSFQRDVVVANRRGRVLRNIDGEHVATTARHTMYQYGAFGRLELIRQKGSFGPVSETSIEHDARGRILQQTDPDSGPTNYTYNGFGDVLTSLDPKGQLRTYTHDDLGRTTSIVDLAGETRWIFDRGTNGIGRLSETISPRTDANLGGQRLVYSYEPPVPGSGPRRPHDNRGLVSSVDYIIDEQHYPVSFQYDGLGRTTRVDYPDLGNGPRIAAGYTYDFSSGQLRFVDEIGSGTARGVWQINSAFEGQLVQQETFGNGASTTYGYNHAFRFLETIDTQRTSQTIQALRYSHFSNGQVRRRTIATGPSSGTYEDYTYDALGRLDQIDRFVPTGGGGGVIIAEPYGYDALGNLTQRGQTGIAHLTTRPHLIDTVGDNGYDYEENGNLRQRQGPDVPGNVQTFEYTPFDLQKTVVSGQAGATTTTRFEYSAGGQRLVRRDGTEQFPSQTVRHFVTDLYQHYRNDLPTLQSTIEERFRFYAGPRQVAEIVREGGVDKTLYFHGDRLGSAGAISTNLAEVFEQGFDAFGMPTEALSTDITRVGYTGHQHDRDLGLIDMKGRVYDPLGAKFTSADPVTLTSTWSQGLNRYAYAVNDPINMVDPSGTTVIYPGYPAGGVVVWGNLNLWSFVAVGMGVPNLFLHPPSFPAPRGPSSVPSGSNAPAGAGTSPGAPHATGQNGGLPAGPGGDPLCAVFPDDPTCAMKDPLCDVFPDECAPSAPRPRPRPTAPAPMPAPTPAPPAPSPSASPTPQREFVPCQVPKPCWLPGGCPNYGPPVVPPADLYNQNTSPTIDGVDPKQRELNRKFTEETIERAKENYEFITGENPDHHGPHHSPHEPHPIETEGATKPGDYEQWTPSWKNRNGDAPHTRWRRLQPRPRMR